MKARQNRTLGGESVSMDIRIVQGGMGDIHPAIYHADTQGHMVGVGREIDSRARGDAFTGLLSELVPGGINVIEVDLRPVATDDINDALAHL